MVNPSYISNILSILELLQPGYKTYKLQSYLLSIEDRSIEFSILIDFMIEKITIVYKDIIFRMMFDIDNGMFNSIKMLNQPDDKERDSQLLRLLYQYLKVREINFTDFHLH